MRLIRYFIFLVPIFLSALLLPFPCCDFLAEGKNSIKIEEYKKNVVQLTVYFSNKQIKHGFGFIVGERDKKLYVITANHVVRENDLPDVRALTIKARFFTDQGKFHRAELLSAALSDLDMALLEIRAPYKSFKWHKALYCPDIGRGDEVQFIGRNQKWWIPVVFGYIQELPYRGTFPVNTRDVQPGTSGAPLIAKSGIVGMITDDDAYEVKAVEIDEIRTFVQINGYPWNIAECLDIKFYPKRQLMGNDVSINLNKPASNVLVKFQGRALPKRVQMGGRKLIITIPGDAKTGRWPFELEWQGHSYVTEPIEIFIMTPKPPKTTRRAPPSNTLRRRAPPSQPAVSTSKWQRQGSYKGDCRARPVGMVCAAYEDGYVWLIRGAVSGWEKRVEGNQTIQVAITTTGRYEHILRTSYVRKAQ